MTTRTRPAPPARWAWVLLMLVGVAGLLIVIFREAILPSNFFGDGVRIQLNAQGIWADDPSYFNTGAVYRFFGLADRPTLAGVLGWAIAMGLIAIALWRSKLSDPREVSTLIGGAIVIIATSVYLGYYSKDVLVAVLVTAVVLLASDRPFGEISIWTAVAVYAINFRTYYWLVLVGYVGLRWLTRRTGFTVRRWLLSSAAVGVSVSLLLLTVQSSSDFQRFRVNEGRDVTTQIEAFVSLPEPFGGVVNNLITQAALIVPVPLAAAGVFYALIAGAVLTMWVLFFVALRGAHVGGGQSVLAARASCLLAAFLGVQAAFEPDFGSAIRHLSPFMPLMLAVIAGAGQGAAAKSATVPEDVSRR